MRPAPHPLPDTTTAVEAAAVLTRSGQGSLPVADADGGYVGTVSARAVAEALDADEPGTVTVRDLIEKSDAVTAGTSLHDALRPLMAASGSGVPVLDPDTGALTGWITHQDLLGALHGPRPSPDRTPAARPA